MTTDSCRFAAVDELAVKIEFPDYNGLVKCTWTAGCPSQASPHVSIPLQKDKSYGILDSVLDAIGNTPMVRVSRFAKKYGIQCELLAKCEFLNAGGSVKDRIGKRMVEEAEVTGLITPGATLIEPTSGNTGIGLSMAAAVKGYKMVITLPEKMSQEKVNMMKALGAEILRTPTEAAWNAPESHIGLALKLQKSIPNAFILDQYKNPANPLAHYEATAEEILEQCDGKLDMVVVCAGTGGTITGIGRKLKERLPNCVIVGVDPKGSILAVPEELNDERKNMPYLVEGIGYDFIPTALDRSVVDEWVKSDDAESFRLARDLIRLEGLLCGGSSGAAMVGVLAAASRLQPGQRCVVLLPDSSRNYMSKFISDDWMFDQGFSRPIDSASNPLWQNKTVANLKLQFPITVLPDVSVFYVVSLMDQKGINQVPVVKPDGEVLGVVTEGNLATSLESGRLKITDPVSMGMYKKFKKVCANCPLSDVSRMLDLHPFVLITTEQECHTTTSNVRMKEIVTGVVTRIDLLRLLSGEAQSSDETKAL